MRKINDGLTTAQRYRKRNRERLIEKSRLKYQKNKEKIKEYRLKKYWSDPEGHHRSMLRHRYGVDAELYETILAAQNAKCAICERDFSQFKRRPSVDHDHVTGRVRALLCDSCNMKVGVIEHSLYPKVIDYLNKYSMKKVS